MEDQTFNRLEKAVTQAKRAWEAVKDEEELPEEIKDQAKQTWVEAIQALQNAQKG